MGVGEVLIAFEGVVDSDVMVGNGGQQIRI